jgi:hypothetical protein
VADVATPSSAPSARTWLIAILELLAALVVARVIAGGSATPGLEHHGSNMAGMAGTTEATTPIVEWGWLSQTASGVAVGGTIWWLFTRHRIAAATAAAGLSFVASSPAVRVLATQSHLIAMAALEVLMVIVPLLVVAAVGERPSSRTRSKSTGWTSYTVAAASLYAAFLIAVHVPVVHGRGAALGAVPLWVVFVALLVGTSYWFAVLRTAGLVPTGVRRTALFGAQEVAGFVGLLSLFGAWGSMAHGGPLAISTTWDQRLGGIFMMITCAAAVIPIARRLDAKVSQAT